MDYGRNFIQRYGCAVVGVALAVSVRLLLDPFLGFAYPFATLFVAILAAAWYGGLGPALTAVVLGGLCAIYFIIPPRGVFFPEGWYQDVGLVLYTCAGIGISLLGGAVDFARRSAEAAVRCDDADAGIPDGRGRRSRGEAVRRVAGPGEDVAAAPDASAGHREMGEHQLRPEALI